MEYQWLKAGLSGRDRIPVIDPPHAPDQYFPLDRGAERWTEVRGWLQGIQQMAAAQGVPVVMVLFPIEFQVDDTTYPVLPQQMVGAMGQDLGMTVVDLLPVFQQACREKTGGPCQFEDRYLFADVWMHPSALGNTLAAQQIKSVVQRQ